MINEIVQLFIDFQKEERRYNLDKYAAQLEQSADRKKQEETAYKYYKQSKDFNDNNRRRRFTLFLKRRRQVLDMLEKSAVESNMEQIENEIQQTAESELQKLVDKTFRYYFNMR